jgi:hypothetical protein
VENRHTQHSQPGAARAHAGHRSQVNLFSNADTTDGDLLDSYLWGGDYGRQTNRRGAKGIDRRMTDALTIIPPGRPLRGRASPPGSKSITNRTLLPAALARGTSGLTGVLQSDDTHYMIDASRAICVSVQEPETSFVVTATSRLRAPAVLLFSGQCRNRHALPELPPPHLRTEPWW